jgi:hypothetical protein
MKALMQRSEHRGTSSCPQFWPWMGRPQITHLDGLAEVLSRGSPHDGQKRKGRDSSRRPQRVQLDVMGVPQYGHLGGA